MKFERDRPICVGSVSSQDSPLRYVVNKVELWMFFPAGSLILAANIVTAMFSWFSSVIQRTKIGTLEVEVPQ